MYILMNIYTKTSLTCSIGEVAWNSLKSCPVISRILGISLTEVVIYHHLWLLSWALTQLKTNFDLELITSTQETKLSLWPLGGTHACKLLQLFFLGEVSSCMLQRKVLHLVAAMGLQMLVRRCRRHILN